ncbi:hypothetical protein SKAU_G00415920 [Synaphobranchus kaupii]|uniref:Uncharacterized protein n=1 Tax=Synaphobranchus kaupii TaxID=118154 RepID=A0A9Q1IBI5_SYNKA|nr:hypothetical protein SKAU_G00415920 [Synaphobranchus kaupii]
MDVGPRSLTLSRYLLIRHSSHLGKGVAGEEACNLTQENQGHQRRANPRVASSLGCARSARGLPGPRVRRPRSFGIGSPVRCSWRAFTLLLLRPSGTGRVGLFTYCVNKL